jgi:preprotein translocase subunit SecB
MSMTNGGPAEQQPQLSVVVQYVKDLSFENPNAPRTLMAAGEPPQIGIQVNVNAAPVSETDVEVVLMLTGKAETPNGLIFGFELQYGGVFRVQNVPQESLNPILMIECPRLLFPFAREIIATAVRNGGFPPLMIDPVDFAALYRQRLAQIQGGGTADTPG